jgi:DNA-directed RNA polymerase specialized sigma24 family protein
VKYYLNDISRSEIEKAIDEWILNERDREILKRRLVDGITYEALSYEFNLSVRHTKTIVYKGEERLFTKIAHK